MLKLVYNADPIQLPPPQAAPMTKEIVDFTPFHAKFDVKGPYLYQMEVRDNSHYLGCELTLEIEDTPLMGGSKIVICRFPEICDEKLNAFIWDDDILYAITMIQFQMKMLKELLAFCLGHHATKLIIMLNEDQAEDFGIYQDFLVYDDLLQSQEEGLATMVLPVNEDIYEEWMAFMNQAILRFQQTLWQNQRKNAAVRHYLKFHPFVAGC